VKRFLLEHLVAERNLAVLFTEHSMQVVFEFADSILVMARGRVIAHGSADQIRLDPTVREVYFGGPQRAAPVGLRPSR